METDYVILEEPTTLDLERAVREMLHDGYEPIGGPNIFVKDDELTYAQAIYRKATAKRARAQKQPEQYPPRGVSEDVWNAWLKYRKEKKRPITAVAYERLLKQFATWRTEGRDLNGIIQTSIDRGWTGLFAPDEKLAEPQNNIEFLPESDDELVAWATRVGAPMSSPGESFGEYRKRLRFWYGKQ